MLDYLFLVGDVAIAGRSRQFEVLLRRARAGAARARCSRRRRRPCRSPRRSWSAAPRARTASRPAPASPTTTGCAPATTANARRRSPTLVEAGELEPVRVEGWGKPAWLHVDARRPRRVAARTLLSPFDPRRVGARPHRGALRLPLPDRDLRPQAAAAFGYYVLPFLLGDRIVARVDLKADRAAGRLLVQGAYAEAGAPGETAERARRWSCDGSPAGSASTTSWSPTAETSPRRSRCSPDPATRPG